MFRAWMPARGAARVAARRAAQGRSSRVLAALLGCTVSSACARGAEPAEPAAARSLTEEPRELDVLAGERASDTGGDATRESAPLPAFVELDVPEFSPAVLALPEDLNRPRPVLVAAHGAGDGPHWQCELWRHLLAAKGFVLCPAGVPFGKQPDAGYFFRNHHELEREVMASVSALRAAYGDAVAPGPMVYAGYSQGATMGALMLVNHGDTFERIVLIEGGYGEWNVSIAKKYGSSGGQRVLFACGIRACHDKARRSADALGRAGLEARVEYAEGAGHTYGGPVAEKVFAALDWVLEGDPRWR